MNRQTLKILFWVGVGAAGVLVIELLALLATWKDIVNWIVFHY